MHTLKTVLLLSFLSLWCSRALAQETPLSLSQPDTTQFPQISLTLKGVKDLKKAELSLKENGQGVQEVALQSIKEGAAPQPPNALFLIEASGLTRGDRLESTVRQVGDFMDQMPEEAKVNVCWFGRSTNKQNQAARWLSAEFSKNKELIQSKMADVTAPYDTHYVVHLYKALYESMDLVKQQGLTDNTEVFLISRGWNHSNSSISQEDCISKAKKLGLSVHVLTLFRASVSRSADDLKVLADQTGGKSQNLQSTQSLKSELQGIYQGLTGKGPTVSGYRLSYTSPNPKPKGQRQITVSYQDQEAQTRYQPPKPSPSEEAQQPNWVLYGGIAGGVLLVVIVVLVVLQQQKKKKQAEEARRQEEEQERLRQEEEKRKLEEEKRQAEQQAQQAAQKTQVDPGPQKRDPHKTQIGHGPQKLSQVTVEAGGQRLKFSLQGNEITIGRNEENTVTIPEQTVSGSHAKITQQGGTFYYQDLGSTNGTQLNGQKIQQTQLYPGIVLMLGQAKLTFN